MGQLVGEYREFLSGGQAGKQGNRSTGRTPESGADSLAVVERDGVRSDKGFQAGKVLLRLTGNRAEAGQGIAVCLAEIEDVSSFEAET
jgi:hypothetical protein